MIIQPGYTGITPIETGGTGARDAEAARKNLEAVPVLLWRNDDSDANFSGKNITVEDAEKNFDYPIYMMVFNVSVSNKRKITSFSKKAWNGNALHIGNIGTELSLLYLSRIWAVTVETAEKMVMSFENCKLTQGGSNTDNNSYLIPVELYGINVINNVL